MGMSQRATARRLQRDGGTPKEPVPRQAPPLKNRCIDQERPETTQLRGWSVQIIERPRRETPDSPASGGLSAPVGRLATNHRYDGPPSYERVEDINRCRPLGLGIAGQTGDATQVL